MPDHNEDEQEEQAPAAAGQEEDDDDDDDDEDNVDSAAEDIAIQIVESGGTSPPKKIKRLCRYPGCSRVIKSQGHCQRHGAKAKRCRVEGCDKQAQGTHDGMCKRHWKAIHFPDTPPKQEDQPPPPEGESVYDSILPQSIAYRPGNGPKLKDSTTDDGSQGKKQQAVVGDPWEPAAAPDGSSLMPLVSFLSEGIKKEAGWHRNAERRARGMFPVSTLSCQLEPWERQLALVEILLLSGGTPYANFRDLAHAWGREKGFHAVLANAVCERRGEVERKRRSDAGRTLSAEEREAFKEKLKKSRTRAEADMDGEDDNDDDEDEKERDEEVYHDARRKGAEKENDVEEKQGDQKQSEGGSDTVIETSLKEVDNSVEV